MAKERSLGFEELQGLGKRENMQPESERASERDTERESETETETVRVWVRRVGLS